MVGNAPGYLPAGRSARGVVTSDQDGHFLLGGVHPGSATITAISSAAGHGSARGVEVSSGRTSRGLRIQLAPRGMDQDASLAAGNVAVGLGERGSAPNIEVVVVSVAESSEAERAGAPERSAWQRHRTRALADFRRTALACVTRSDSALVEILVCSGTGAAECRSGLGFRLLGACREIQHEGRLLRHFAL